MTNLEPNLIKRNLRRKFRALNIPNVRFSQLAPRVSTIMITPLLERCFMTMSITLLSEMDAPVLVYKIDKQLTIQTINVLHS